MQEYLTYTDEEILERVDEYSLFCHYLEFDPLLGRKYSSPLRAGDTDPSFGIYERKNSYDLPNEYMWKDQANQGRQHGDIFDLIQLMYGLPNRQRAMWKVCGDFGIGGCENPLGTRLVLKEPVAPVPAVIKVVSRPFIERELAYWAQYGITEPILSLYNVRAMKAYWLDIDQKNPYYPKKMGFSYRVAGSYQLYFPLKKSMELP